MIVGRGSHLLLSKLFSGTHEIVLNPAHISCVGKEIHADGFLDSIHDVSPAIAASILFLKSLKPAKKKCSPTRIFGVKVFPNVDFSQFIIPYCRHGLKTFDPRCIWHGPTRTIDWQDAGRPP